MIIKLVHKEKIVIILVICELKSDRNDYKTVKIKQKLVVSMFLT